MQDGTLLQLPGGLTGYVNVNEDGITIRVGRYSDEKVLTMLWTETMVWMESSKMRGGNLRSRKDGQAAASLFISAEKYLWGYFLPSNLLLG